jgi:hypothetical protein
MSLPVVVTPSSKLVAEANAGIVGRRLVAAGRIDATGIGTVRQQEAARETVLSLRPHHASKQVHVPGKAPIDRERDSIDRAGALGGACIRTTGNCAVSSNTSVSRATEAVLPLVVVSTDDVESRGDRILRTDPCGLQDLVVGKVGVVDCTRRTRGTEDEAAGSECAGAVKLRRMNSPAETQIRLREEAESHL